MSQYESADLERIALRLEQGDPGARRVAVMDLAESAHEPGAGRLLLAALHDGDPSVRAEAAKLIDEFPAEELTEALIGALTAADENVRGAAARALADLKDPAAGAALLTALEGASDPFVLAATLRALRNLRYEPAMQAGLRLLAHDRPAVRHEAVGLLGYLRKPETMADIARLALSDPQAEVRRQAVAALVSGDPQVIEWTLIRAVADADWQVRAESSAVIGKLKIAGGVGALIQATEDANWQVREKAVEALGQLGARKALPAIGRCAADEISNLRKAAVTAIGEIADAEGRRYLEPALRDSDPDVRKMARWALDRLGRAA
ncbi:MAG: HEAT repeat domain-containing protein [Gammaproteobacteria bacterium]|nr:HEAT repeat domain-containing protein [Gammaproteobacteria bacterium]